MPVPLFSKLCSCATPAKTHAITLVYHPGLTHWHDQREFLVCMLQKVAKLHPYRTTQCRIMMSYRFFKKAAAAAQYYFRFLTCWCHSIRQVKIYQQTKFRRHISIHGWGITTSVLEKTNVRHIGILLPISISVYITAIIGMLFCIRVTNFIIIVS